MKISKKITSVLAFASLILSGCGEADGVKKYSLDLDYKEDFRILWLTDIHYGQGIIDKQNELAHLKTMIEDANNPDLMILTGDTFWEESASDVDDLIFFIDSFNIKWAFTYGNHDLEPFDGLDTYYINRKISETKNKVFIDYENDDIDGLTNYYINLKEGEKTIYRLYIIDSNSYNADGDYDIIHRNQLEHLININKKEADNAPGLAFFHIPLWEFADAYKGYKEGIYTGREVNEEDCCVGYKNNGAYSVMNSINIKGCFAGHDHVNDSDINYKDEMILSYGLKGSDLCYYDNVLIGYKMITLPKDSSKFSLDCISNHYFPY